MKMLDLQIGTKLFGTDGECGRLAKIVVNPETQEVTDIVVEKGFMLSKQNRVLPIALINRAVDGSIHLNMHCNELENYPEYKEIEIEEPDITMQVRTPVSANGGYSDYSSPMIRRRLRQGIPSEMAVVGTNTPVETNDATIGYVDHVLIDPFTHTITHVVMRQGLLFHEYRMIPVEMIQTVNEHVCLATSSELLDLLPRYAIRDGCDILADVRRRYALDPKAYNGVTATMNGRVLELTGIVRSRAIKYHAEQLVESIDGVIEIENKLQVNLDDDLQIAAGAMNTVTQIQKALAADKRTANAMIDVVDDGGVILLQGIVDNVTTRQVAEDITLQQLGVMTVFNDLVVLQ